MKNNEELTEKQSMFCKYYIIDFNATNAAIQAGYKPKSARQMGHNLVSNPKIQKHLAIISKKLCQKLEVTKERVVEEFARIAFFNIQEAYDKNGNLLPVLDMPENVARAINKLKRNELNEEKFGPNAGYEIEVAFSDKKSALDSLAKYLNLYDDKKPQLGEEGNPIVFKKDTSAALSEVSDDQLDRAIELALKRNSNQEVVE